MNELMFYGGLVLSGIFLIISVILFFYFKVYASISFFSGRGRRYVPAKKSSSSKVKVKKTEKKADKKADKQVPIVKSVQSESTEMLGSSEDYTEILCDDNATEILE